MPQSMKHQRALELMEANQMQEAADLLIEVISEHESSHVWNDWATASLLLNRIDDAKRGYERALALDAADAQCRFNYGVLLVSIGEVAKGLELLRESFLQVGPHEQKAVFTLIDQNSQGKRVLIIGDFVPDPERSQDVQLLEIIRGLRLQGNAVTFISRGEANRRHTLSYLNDLGVQVFAGDCERLRPIGIEITEAWKLKDVLQNSSFDIALFDHKFRGGITVTEQYLDEIRRLSPSTRIAIFAGDAHSIRDWQIADSDGECIDRERSLNFMVRDAECYRAADMVLAVSEDDRNDWLELIPELEIHLLPPALELNDLKKSAKGFDQRHGFTVLADFDHASNRAGLKWLCNEVWPRIRKQLPEATLRVSGNHVPSSLAGDGIEILDEFPSFSEFLQERRVFLAPTQFDLGFKNENAFALACGVPMVATSSGAESMGLEDDENVLVADTAEAFADFAVELHNDSELWQQIAGAGLTHAQNNFSRKQFELNLAAFLKRIDDVTPRTLDNEHRFSARLVEELNPEIFTQLPPGSRQELRVTKYAEAGSRLLSLGHPAEALEQLRHIFGFLLSHIPPTMFFAHIFSLMERSYRELGDDGSAVRCGEAAKLCLPELNSGLRLQASAQARDARTSALKISVIIPTFNRQAGLERCLNALSGQTLGAELFEVIVVDDGSTDETPGLLQTQKRAFQFLHFRQPRQGSGAARKLAAERARGEYLLLMDDNTIADPDLLKEHLHAHASSGENRLVVLGSFGYQREARKRALSHFLSMDSFLFPQSRISSERLEAFPQFMTNNLSMRRQLALSAGSFDPDFKFGENTDLGLRIARRGCKVAFHPRARATHETDINMDGLLQRAKAHGAMAFELLKKHPGLKFFSYFAEIGTPLTSADVVQLRKILGANMAAVRETEKSLRQFDAVDFQAFANTKRRQGTAADQVLGLFRESVPLVYWFAVIESLCDEWNERNAFVPSSTSSVGASL